MKKIVKIFRHDSFKVLLCIVLFMAIFVSIFPKSYASGVVVKKVSIESSKSSYSSQEEGAWHIDKSASWTSKGKARITFDVNTILMSKDNYNLDLILVLDNSGSMYSTKLDLVKDNVNRLISGILTNSNNRVSLISFDSESKILSGFTNDVNTLKAGMDELGGAGSTNYYAALNNVDEVLKTYTPSSNRRAVVVFFTDGYPNVDTPNEVSKYSYLKSTYPFLTINAIQYDAGDEIHDALKNISDSQYLADNVNLLEVFQITSIDSVIYDKFNITDVVSDYFIIDNIETSYGNATITDNQVLWELPSFRSGFSAKMTIDVSLKSNYLNVGGFYETNASELIDTSIKSVVDTVNSTKSPVLANSYTITYEGNAPSGCTVSNVPSNSEGFVFDTIKVSSQVPVCAGYKFKEWKVVTTGVTKNNDGSFIMPEYDVTLKAIWAKPNINKEMDGTISEKLTMYKTVKRDYDNGNGVKLYDSNDDNYPKSGETFSGSNDIYYYYGGVTNNNVIFGNFCWKIVRTTSTGGVKMIYNGSPDTEGRCNNTGDASQLETTSAFTSNGSSLGDVGYMYNKLYVATTTNTTTSGRYTFGTSVTYSGGRYRLSNTKTFTSSQMYNTNTYSWQLGSYHYTCMSTSTSCTTVHYVFSYNTHLSEPISLISYTMTSGTLFENIVNDMLYGSDVNTNDSLIKTVIDTWYKNNMIGFTKYLEDTMFCGNRLLEDHENNGLYPNSATLSDSTPLFDYKSLTCKNITDNYTLSVAAGGTSGFGNNSLTYPVALLSAHEANIAYDSSARSNNYLATGNEYWLLSPGVLWLSSPIQTFADTEGEGLAGAYGVDIEDELGVRPVVSLRGTTSYITGDGSADYPYLIDTRS